MLRPLRRKDALPPALAIDALLAAMRVRFDLAQASIDRLLRPALADFRDAVGCADPLLLASNAKAEPQLVPLPLPSWCAWMIDAGLLELTGEPRVEGPRIVQQAALAVVREAELQAVERFPVVFAGRFAPGAPQVHLAVSPPFMGGTWRGPVCVRAAAERRLRIGGPASPVAASEGEEGETVATWVTSSWPRWIVLRLLEGREPQALWSLPTLWRARMGDAPEGALTGGHAAPASMRLGVDLGSTSTVVVEEDVATSGTPGAKLFAARRVPSGFRLLAGDPATAHRFGCGEELSSRAGHLPTALAAGSPAALERVLTAPQGALQLWLPQAGEGDAPIVADRFKSPDLLLLADWLAALPQLDSGMISRALLDAYGTLLGRTLACAHAAPMIVNEGGRWAARWPRLEQAEVALSYPQCAWNGSEPFARIFEQVAAALGEGLRAGWGNLAHTLVADPVAARAASELREPAVEAFADFGGLTLEITVRVPQVPGRPAPLIAGSALTVLLGGERVLDAAAFAEAARDANLRSGFRAASRRWRSIIARGQHAGTDVVADAISKVVVPLVNRQIDATVRRASLDHAALRGAPLRLVLLGEAWKLAALDVPDPDREAAAMQRLSRWFGTEVARVDKHRLCAAALRARGEVADPAIELQGVDAAQRYFAVAGTAQPPQPLAGDPWWRQFAGEAPSLLRVEHWFASEGAFESGLAAGAIGLDGSRSVLKQWLDVCGASLLALRIHSAA